MNIPTLIGYFIWNNMSCNNDYIREMEEMEYQERRRELQAMRETQLISQLKNAGPSDSKIVVLCMDN